MRRLVLGGTAALALLLGASVAVVLFATRPPPPATVSGPPADVPIAAAAPVADAPAPPARPAGSPLHAMFGARRARAAAAASSPASALPAATRVVRTIVRKRLLAGGVQARLAHCVGATGAPDDAAARGDPALLVLELEARSRVARVVDAHVESWGGASQASVDCAREVLRGETFTVPAVEQGRTRMPFLLNPRGEALSSR
ncbi:MAG TPA: hypothetical protein VFL83_18495 [Anaeromyxobacter sp.]|nr:hypothetical protein [Anaeromyxobacter sp.]